MFGWEENKWGRKIWKENKNVFPLILFGLKENRGGRKIKMENNKLKLLFTFSPI